MRGDNVWFAITLKKPDISPPTTYNSSGRGRIKMYDSCMLEDWIALSLGFANFQLEGFAFSLKVGKS